MSKYRDIEDTERRIARACILAAYGPGDRDVLDWLRAE